MTIPKEPHTWIMDVTLLDRQKTKIIWEHHPNARIWEGLLVQQQPVDASHSKKILALEDALAFDLGYAGLRENKLKSLAAEFGGEEFLPKKIKAMFGNKRLPVGMTRTDLLNKVERLYGNFYTNYQEQIEKTNPVLTTTSRIPHIVHHIWFGPPMPENYRVWRTRWKKLHAQWRHICWNEEMIAAAFPEGLINQAAFDQAKQIKNYAKMSDIARYEILYAFGGVYADSDLQPFVSFEKMHKVCDFFAGLEEFRTELELGNAIIGARPQHPILKRCIDLINVYQKYQPDMKEWDLSHARVAEVNVTLVTTGPVLLTKAFLERGGQENNRDVALPAVYLYATNVVHPDATLCKHYFDDSWIGLLSLDEQKKSTKL